MQKLQAKKIPAPEFTRVHDRFEVSLDLTLQILIPEDTFTPRGLDGTTMDISARGMKVSIPKLSGEMYTKLLKGTRYARVCFVNPVNDEQIKLTGQVAWFDFHKPSATTPNGTCYMGIQFDEKTGPALAQYEQLIHSLDAA